MTQEEAATSDGGDGQVKDLPSRCSDSLQHDSRAGRTGTTATLVFA